MKESPYDNEIKKLEEEQKRIGAELSEANQRKADFLCPHKVGDILVDKKGRQAKVSRIYAGWGDYCMKLRYILKSGALGTQSHEFYDFDEWKPLDN